MDNRLERKIGNLVFRNPVISASGTFGMGDVFEDFIDYQKIGGITLKTITRHPRVGNPPPRMLETPAGILNSIGLENEGFDAYYQKLKKNDFYRSYPTNIILSVAGETVDDYVMMTEKFSEFEGVDLIELNLSCPNVEEGGATFDSNCHSVQSILSQIKKKNLKPIAAKLSPNQDFIENSKIAECEGADAVTISNTFIGMAINIWSGDFVFKNKTAGFSGPAVKPIALANVYRVRQEVKIPIIASGGISSPEDAIEFMLAGATLVSAGTMGFIEPDIAETMVNGITDYFQKTKLKF